MLEGLLEQQTGLRPTEIMTDTTVSTNSSKDVYTEHYSANVDNSSNHESQIQNRTFIERHKKKIGFGAVVGGLGAGALFIPGAAEVVGASALITFITSNPIGWLIAGVIATVIIGALLFGVLGVFAGLVRENPKYATSGALIGGGGTAAALFVPGLSEVIGLAAFIGSSPIGWAIAIIIGALSIGFIVGGIAHYRNNPSGNMHKHLEDTHHDTVSELSIHPKYSDGTPSAVNSINPLDSQHNRKLRLRENWKQLTINQIKQMTLIGKGSNRLVYRDTEFPDSVYKIPSGESFKRDRGDVNAPDYGDKRLNVLYKNGWNGVHAKYAVFDVALLQGVEVTHAPYMEGKPLREGNTLDDCDVIPDRTIDEVEKYGMYCLDAKPSNFWRMPNGDVLPSDGKYIALNMSASLRTADAHLIVDLNDGKGCHNNQFLASPNRRFNVKYGGNKQTLHKARKLRHQEMQHWENLMNYKSRDLWYIKLKKQMTK